MAEKNLAELDLTSESGLYGNKNIEGYRGFYWLYDISDVVDKFLKKHHIADIPDGIKKILSGFKTAVSFHGFLKIEGWLFPGLDQASQDMITPPISIYCQPF